MARQQGGGSETGDVRQSINQSINRHAGDKGRGVLGASSEEQRGGQAQSRQSATQGGRDCHARRHTRAGESTSTHRGKCGAGASATDCERNGAWFETLMLQVAQLKSDKDKLRSLIVTNTQHPVNSN